tara:strand:- start:11560 stop:12396 length:837 start_codon:yes stop_codon:yes gene_type:complete
MRKLLSMAVFFTIYASATFASDVGPTYEVVLTSDVKWGALNPARGDKGPRAGNLWGDRTGSGPSGFLVKFEEGFSSPPHIHNISYRGVVIRGLVHNDDPNAEDMWLPTSSYWTQPAGEVHITSANAGNNLAYIEIEEGPYLVLPVEEAFDNGERSINVDASNIVWLDQSVMAESGNEPKIAYLWSKPQSDMLNGTLIKLPPGFGGEMHSSASILRAILVQGAASHQVSDEGEFKKLEPGSYFGSKGEMVHHISCDKKLDCIFYVRTNGKFEVISNEDK